MTDEDLKAIQARAEAATPGPWVKMTVEDGDSDSGPNGHYIYNCEIGVVPERDLKEWDGKWELSDASVARPYMEQDADFIARARDDVPALVAEIRAMKTKEVYLTNVNTRLQGLVDRARKVLLTVPCGRPKMPGSFVVPCGSCPRCRLIKESSNTAGDDDEYE